MGNTHPCLPLLYFPPRNSPCQFLCHGSGGAPGALCCCRDPGGSCLGTSQERWSPWDPATGLEQPSATGSGEGGRSPVVQGLIIEIDPPLCHASIPARVHSGSPCPGDAAWHAQTRVCDAHGVGQGWGWGEQPRAPGRGRGQAAGVCFGGRRGGEHVQVSAGCCVHGGAHRGSRCQYFISSHAGEEAEGGCKLAACFGEAQGAAERGLSWEGAM